MQTPEITETSSPEGQVSAAVVDDGEEPVDTNVAEEAREALARVEAARQALKLEEAAAAQRAAKTRDEQAARERPARGQTRPVNAA
ncbi:MAG: hypothetical protein H6993_11125 [Pseudomonadales bacterium]|nr:hypothetical protein [Pseudomonadales bacterium]MCP5184508.1 hypothetical protein [Pseudomonadales bacterium]